MYVVHVLFCRNGIVKLSGDSQEGNVDFRISFIRYEKKKMYLIRNEGRFFILAHFSVEECDIVHQDIPDDAVEFPLRERHYELEVVVVLSHTVVLWKLSLMHVTDNKNVPCHF